MLSGLDKLPADLKLFVKEDNHLFDKELADWDLLQARKAQQEKLALAAAALATASATAAAASSGASPQPMSTEPSPPDNSGQGHARFAVQTRTVNGQIDGRWWADSSWVSARCF